MPVASSDPVNLTDESREPPPYHPNIKNDLKKGYLCSLNEKQKATLAEFQKLFPVNSPTSELVKAYPTCYLDWHYDAVLLRFLRARKFVIKDAEKMLKANIKYRIEHAVPGLLAMKDIAEVLDNPDVTYSDLAQYYPHGRIGFDKSGRPVTYKLWGNFQVWNLKKLCPLDNLTKFHVWEQEHLFKEMLHWSSERNYNCETITAVIDIKGMKLKQITRDFLYLIKAMANVDQNHYPERMGCTYIINCPSMFSFVWKGIVPWLDKNTAAKIKILASEKEWRPVMEQDIGLDMLPPLYGGTQTSIEPACMASFYGIEKIDEVSGNGDERTSFGSGAYDIYRFDSSIDYDPEEGADATAESDKASSDFHSARGGSMEDGDIESSGGVISPREEGKSTPYSRCCKKLMCLRPCFTASGDLHLISWLQRWPLRKLCLYADISNALLCFASISIIVFISYFISSDVWMENSGSVEFILWIFIVTIVLAALMLLVAFYGILAVHYQNVHLLKFHSRALTTLSIFLLLVATISIVYSANIDSWLSSRLDTNLSEAALETFRKWNYVIVSTGFVAIILCFIPGIFCAALRRRFINIIDNASKQGITDVFYRSNMQRIRQQRFVLRCTNTMSLCFALSCIGFGSYGVQQAIQYHLDYPVYAPFILAEIGIVLTILSMVAYWASSSKRVRVFSAYQYLSVPFIIALVSISVITLIQVTVINASDIEENYLSEGEAGDAAAGKVKVTMITSGVLEAMTAFFFTQNLLVSRKLFRSVVKSQRAVSWREHQIATEIGMALKDEEHSQLSRRELIACAAMFISGFFCLFFDGTYLAFASYVNDRDGWITALWREMNKVDERYTKSDPFVMSMVFLATFIFGPLSMLYSWALLTRKRYAHILGIVVGACTLMMQVLYLLTAYYTGGWKHFKFDGNYWGFRFLFFFVKVILIQGIFMFWIVVFEAKRAVGSAFEHEDIPLRTRKEDQAIDFSAAKVLFGGSTDDLSNLVDKNKVEGGGGELRRRRSSTPFKQTQL